MLENCLILLKLLVINFKDYLYSANIEERFYLSCPYLF